MVAREVQIIISYCEKKNIMGLSKGMRQNDEAPALAALDALIMADLLRARLD
jgi:hypothetical protein